MRVWIVNPYDNLPIEGYRKERYWLMAEAFARAGYAVTYWTQDFSHAMKARRRLSPDALPVPFDLRFLPVPAYRGNVCLGRVLSHAVWARRLAAAFRAERVAPGLIVVSSPPLLQGRAARRFASARGIPYVLDVMDAWPETFERLGTAFRLSGTGTVMRRFARANYRAAAAVTCVARRYAEMVRGAYGVTAPVAVFHHGIERASVMSARAACVPGRVRLAYVGNMSLSYDLATLVDAVKREPSFTLELAGKGPDEPALRAQAADCERIVFAGYLGAAALAELLARSDAGVVPMFDDSCVGVPYKLADYAAAGLPVVSSLHGETADLLSETGAGATYDAGDVDGLIAAVKALDAAVAAKGAARLAERFDAKGLYDAYVAFAVRAAKTKDPANERR